MLFIRQPSGRDPVGGLGWIGSCAHLGRALGLGLGDLAGPLVEGILGTLGHVDAWDVLLLGDALEASGVTGLVATHPGADHGGAADGDAGGGRADALAQRGARGESTDGGHRVDKRG